jgi:hypothetical protein
MTSLKVKTKLCISITRNIDVLFLGQTSTAWGFFQLFKVPSQLITKVIIISL